MNSMSVKAQFDHDAFVQFSSGTTGQPKPARLSHFNVVNNANIMGRFAEFHEQHEIFCLNGQLIYGFGRTVGVLAATMFASTVVLPGPFFEQKSTMEAVTKHRCTVAFGSPTIILDMLNELQHGDYDVSSLRKAIVGGAVCNPEVVEKAKTRLNIQTFYNIYGATETSPVVSSTNPHEPADRWIRTVGTPLDHVEAGRCVNDRLREHQRETTKDEADSQHPMLVHLRACAQCSPAFPTYPRPGGAQEPVVDGKYWRCRRGRLRSSKFLFNLLRSLTIAWLWVVWMEAAQRYLPRGARHVVLLSSVVCRSTLSSSAAAAQAICQALIVPVNTSGELCTRGPHVFKGYLNDDAKTKEALRENWYHTGDEGTMTEDGRITFSGRITEMINTQSFKVPPLEVESLLNTHPDVEEAQVCFLKRAIRCVARMSRAVPYNALVFATGA
ncbi:hypothetical protein HPB47_007388 [Ixodes persulcatus]|uniref:Uncharacterized protein n=1 Tax=Ixodes persulcatus TaxID=34615 RepID=A0AC60P7Z3_IXOPE|nr:hypothetical protein HPB47_007388 [Ixodes persulcatus]